MSPSPSEEAGRTQRRTGGRSERVVKSVLEAAIAEIARVGYAALRVDEVAARAGVNKTTVYRRWPTKPELVTAAIRSLVGAQPEAPDTGALRSDLLVLLRRNVAKARRPEGRTISRVILLERDHPEVAEIARELRAEHLAVWEEVVRRATARGEIPEGSDPHIIVDTLSGALFSRMNRTRHRVDEDYLSALVDLVVAGARAGGAVLHGRARAS